MAKKKSKPEGDAKAATESPKFLYHEVKGQKRVSFDYEKGNYFRVIHVDGAIGGPTPRGDGIQMGLYSERVPIPKSEEYSISAEGTLGGRVDMKVRPGIFRELEVEAILSVEMARRLRDWLDKNINAIEQIRAKGAPNA